MYMMLKRTTVIAILLLTAIPVSSPAQAQAQATPELRKAMRSRLEAVWTKDAETWSRLTADDFTVVIPEGILMNKAERIASLKAEKPASPHEIRQEQTRVYGNTVIHRFVDGSEWVLEVWVRQHGVWRVVAAQVNIAKP